MNPYQIIMQIQQRMQMDPWFAQRFNELIGQLNTMPGLQEEVMRIIKINDPKKRQKAIDKLPKKAKSIVEDMLSLINA